LWEAELFGHEKGAFTGAHAARAGKLEAADRGTILLDEVGEMPLESQAKLLRVLETREVIRVGGTRPIPLDLRFLAATNRDLAQAAGQGRFRLDLYARLAHAVIRIPPLRERVEDVPSLLRRFLDSAGLSGLRLAVEDVERLMRHSWPLNVREMATLAPFFAAQAGGDSAALSLTAPILQRLEEYAHLTSSPVGGGAPAAGPPPPQPGMQRQVPPAEPAAPPAALEASTLRSLLAKHSGNVTEVAAELRLHRFQLYRLLRRHGLDPEEFR
jgi:DNA-binding NtrC family response regulator